MTLAAEPIHTFLLDLGIAKLTGDWQAFISFLPDSPNNAIVVYDTAGKVDGRIMKTGERITHPGIQIGIRGANYSALVLKVLEIAEALDNAKRTLIAVDSETTYILHNASRTGDIIPVGVEEVGDRRRHLFTINATITIEEGV